MQRTGCGQGFIAYVLGAGGLLPPVQLVLAPMYSYPFMFDCCCATNLGCCAQPSAVLPRCYWQFCCIPRTAAANPLRRPCCCCCGVLLLLPLSAAAPSATTPPPPPHTHKYTQFGCGCLILQAFEACCSLTHTHPTHTRRDTLKQLMIKKEIVGDLLNHLRLARQRSLAAERAAASGSEGEGGWEDGRAAAAAGGSMDASRWGA